MNSPDFEKMWEEITKTLAEELAGKKEGEKTIKDLSEQWKISYERTRRLVNLLVKHKILIERKAYRTSYYSPNPEIEDFQTMIAKAQDKAAAASGKSSNSFHTE